jgi:hypothetical protein
VAVRIGVGVGERPDERPGSQLHFTEFALAPRVPSGRS